jgi:hypothetical protein
MDGCTDERADVRARKSIKLMKRPTDKYIHTSLTKAFCFDIRFTNASFSGARQLSDTEIGAEKCCFCGRGYSICVYNRSTAVLHKQQLAHE